MTIKRFKHEREFHSGWWAVTLPPDWSAEAGKVSFVFTREPMLGALHISTAHKEDAAITDDDLLQLTGDAVALGVELEPVQYPAVTGFRAAYVRDEVSWREWWLRAGRMVLHASYNVDVGSAESEAEEAERIVASLRPDAGAPDSRQRQG